MGNSLKIRMAVCCAVSILMVSSALFANKQWKYPSYLAEVKFDHPICATEVNLDVSKESFFEVENKVSGVQTYNTLVRLYKKKDWANFEERLVTFRSVFVSSPLQEAAAFLKMQADFEKFRNFKSDKARGKLLKKYKELMLLFPQSTLIPAIMATAGQFWMIHNKTDRALGIFEKARNEYPFHRLKCVFLMGSAEGSFQTGSFPEAMTRLNLVLQKCTNPRILAAAKFRLLDIKFKKKEKNLAAEYEAVIKSQLTSSSEKHPAAFYQVGELKFREGNTESAEFYFKEYLKNEKQEKECIPFALKRLADIALLEKRSLREVAGKYFLASEMGPNTDIGKFSYLHGLLLEFRNLPIAEQQRRIKVFDLKVDEIETRKYRSAAYLEKGLVLLDMGEKGALEYLVRLDELVALGLRKGKVADYVRNSFLKMLQREIDEARKANRTQKYIKATRKRVREVLADIRDAYDLWLKGSTQEKRAKKLYTTLLLETFRISPKEKEKAVRKTLTYIREAYASWLKGTDQEKKAKEAYTNVLITMIENNLPTNERDRNRITNELNDDYVYWIMETSFEKRADSLYSRIQTDRFSEKINAGLVKNAGEVLTNWIQHPIYSFVKSEPKFQKKIGASLVGALINSEDPEKLAFQMKKYFDVLDMGVDNDYHLLWLAVALRTEDKKKSKEIAGQIGEIRKDAKLDSDIPEEIREYLWLQVGRAMIQNNRFEDAEKAFQKVKNSKFKSIAMNELLTHYFKEETFEKAFDVLMARYQSLGSEKKKEGLNALKKVVQDGRLWTKGEEILKLAEDLKIEGPELASFLFLGGRANFGLSLYKNTINHLEKAIKLAPESKDVAEARFKLGKSLLQAKKSAQAVEVFRNLVDMDDSFYSPLAANELNLMEKK